MKRNSWIFAFLLVCSLLAGSIFLRGYVVITLVSLAQLCWDSNDYPIVIQSWEGNTDAPNVIAGSNNQASHLGSPEPLGAGFNA